VTFDSMTKLTLIAVFVSLVLLPSAINGQSCPNTILSALACPSGGTCTGECTTATAGPGACAGGRACVANELCIQEECLTVSSDAASCNNGAPCPAGPPQQYCVSGQCVVHTDPAAPGVGNCATNGCSAASATKICFRGCFPYPTDLDVANGPCTPGPCGGGNKCLKVCATKALPASCPAPTTAKGTCVATGVAGTAPCNALPGGACSTGLQCIQAACLKKTDSMCPPAGQTGACTPNQACIFGTCVNIAGGGCGAKPCAADEACVEGCVPVDGTGGACPAPVGPCTAGTPLCVQGCASAAPPVAAQPRCEDASGALKPNADVCDDDPAFAAQCPTTFPPTAGAKRPALCDDPLLPEAAKRCAKTCKICCELPAYACDDQTQPAGAPTCAQNKLSGACQSFRPLMQQQCPATCGLCQSTGNTGCVDKLASGCFQMRAYCVITTSTQYMKENCAKTCDTAYPGNGFCSGAGGGGAGTDKASNCQVNANLCNNSIYYKIMTDNCCATCNRCGTAAAGGGSNPNCQDQNPNCASWNVRGFCQSSFYTQAQKQQYCSKTCRFC
ncbi:Protein F01D5.1, partial [Aphelenchoides avenae]